MILLSVTLSTHNQPPEENDADPQPVTLFTILKSVFASFVGIQTNANRIRDFESGKFWHFFAAGVIFVVVFLLSILAIVKYLIATSS